MELTPASVLLRLLTVVLGIASGACLYEQRILVPSWFPVVDGRLSIDTAAWRGPASGKRFWLYVTNGPLTMLTLLSIWPAWHLASTGRGVWWLLAAAFAALERSMTLGWFIPTGVKLMASPLPLSPRAEASVRRWYRLNWLRCGLFVAGFTASLEAVAELSAAM